ncbi:MAG: holin family protein [Rhodobacteraceae bacterium]|nr:holin family protein [Paracoccaceae bacterium]
MSIFNLGRTARQVGGAVAEVAEVFTINATKAEQAAHQRYVAALGQAGAEFERKRKGWFDRFIDGLNRLPRPMLALSTIALFAYAMKDPAGFSERMQGLAYVPEPLWWLLGAVVSFYFGARELSYFRGYRPDIPVVPVLKAEIQPPSGANPALDEWRGTKS